MSEEKKVQLNIRNIPEELMKEVKRIAKEQDKSVAQVIREKMREVVEQEKKRK